MSVDVIFCRTKKQFADFLQVPFALHQHDVNWVPPLRMTTKRILSKKNPFFQQAELGQWVAYRGRRLVGRIAGVINHVHNQHYQDNTVFWGFFESEDTPEVSAALFAAVEDWASAKGYARLLGPMSPSINYECGLQISAFESKPFLMMPQNPAYYPRLVEQQGFVKAKDLQAWIVDVDAAKMDVKKSHIIQALKKKYQVTIRSLDMANFDAEMNLLVSIYNDAWQHNWGYLPMNADEFKYLAKELKSFIMPNFVYIAEIGGVACGFSVALPDLNQIFATLRNGRLLPLNFIRLLWQLKVKKVIDQGRIPLLGVLNAYQHIPIGAMLYYEYLDKIKHIPCRRGELSWILEDNTAMQSGLRLVQAAPYKTYRLYEKNLKDAI